jgi:hypothetical protein
MAMGIVDLPINYPGKRPQTECLEESKENYAD